MLLAFYDDSLLCRSHIFFLFRYLSAFTLSHFLLIISPLLPNHHELKVLVLMFSASDNRQCNLSGDNHVVNGCKGFQLPCRDACHPMASHPELRHERPLNVTSGGPEQLFPSRAVCFQRSSRRFLFLKLSRTAATGGRGLPHSFPTNSADLVTLFF